MITIDRIEYLRMYIQHGETLKSGIPFVNFATWLKSTYGISNITKKYTAKTTGTLSTYDLEFVSDEDEVKFKLIRS